MRVPDVSRVAVVVLLGVLSGSAMAQAPWSYVPGHSDGGVLQDLKAVRPIEGCNIPGGLTTVVGNTDEPGKSAPMWCGTPPFCLSSASVGVNEICDMLAYSRREPRYSPAGAPGVNAVRHPFDLRCRNTGDMPLALSTGTAANSAEDGRCPPPCSAQTFVDGACTFNIPERKHTESASATYSSGYISGSMSATCYLGSWTVTSSSCIDSTPPPPPPPPPPSGGDGDGDGTTLILNQCNSMTDYIDCGGAGASGFASLSYGNEGDVSNPIWNEYIQTTYRCSSGSWRLESLVCNPIGLAE